jgi:hypothetical protein
MRILSLGLLLVSLPVLAERNIFDLMFLPQKGTVYGTTSLTLSEGKIWGSSATITESGYRFSQELGYTVTDRLSVSTDMNLLYRKSNYRYNTNLSSDSTYERGLSDPTINVKFRAQEGSLIVDLLGGVVFDTGQTKISYDRKKNNKQGGTSYKAGLNLGQKSSDFQWSILGQYERFGDHHIDESKSTYGDSTMEGYNAYLIRVDFLKNVTENSFARFFILSDIIDSREGNGLIAYDPITSYELGPEYQYFYSKDLLLKAGISYATIKSTPSPTDTWNLNLSTTYQF